MDENSESNLKIRRHIRSSIVFQVSLICGLLAAALVLVPLFAHYAGMIPEVTPRDFADSPVQKAIDQYSLQAEGNITTLERIINKTLNVPVSTNEDGNLVVEYQGKRTTLDSSYILSEEDIAEPTIAAEFGSAEELAANGSLKAGDVVRTQSFYSGANRGGATYDVVEKTGDAQPDGMSKFGLANGLVAVIRPQNGMVSVDQLGAHADNSTDDYPYIQAAIDLGYKTVAFEGGDYRFDHQIHLSHSNLTLFGNESTLHYFENFVRDDDGVGGDYVIIVKDGSNDAPLTNIYLQNLNLQDERTGENGNTGEVNMIRVANAEHVELYGCTISATDHSVGDSKVSVTNLDLRTYWKDVIIDSCTLVNKTLADNGGTIWVRGGTKGTGKLVMRNNSIEKSSHDECVAVFHHGTTSSGEEFGYIDGVIIDANSFIIDDTNVSLASTPVFNFGLDTYQLSNIMFTNNNVDVKAAAGLFTIFNANNVDISNNNMSFTLLSRPDVPDLAAGILYCDGSSCQNVSAGDNILTVTASEGAQMGSLVRAFDKFFRNDVSVTAPIGSMFDECVSVDDNTIDIDTSDFINRYRSFDNDKHYPFFSIYAWRDNVPDVISFTGNKITFNEQLFEHQDVRIVSVSDVEMSGTSLYVSDDVIEGMSQEDANKKMLSITGCQDTEGTSAVYALRNDSSLFDAIDISSNKDDGLYLVVDDESVSSLPEDGE